MAVAERKQRTPPRGRTPNDDTDLSANRERRRSRRGSHALRELLIAAAIFFTIQIFFVQAFRIPSESMVPTLLVGDFLFVNKLAFGPHIPFTKLRLRGYDDPRPDEVAVFESPYQADQPEDPTPTVVKRIVGTPGDTIFMRRGVYYVNGAEHRLASVPMDEPRPPEADVASPEFAWMRRYALTGSRFGAPVVDPSHDNWGPMAIPAGHYFAMGDNRYNSKDARYYGFVPRENFKGRPLFIYFSVDFEAWDVRWSRFGDRIH